MSRPPAGSIPPLTVEQAALADRRAQCLVAAAEVLDARAAALGGFTSIRDVGGAARQAGVAEPDWRAEKAMVRAAGFGRIASSGLLGNWQTLLGAAHEASRRLAEPLDVAGVSRRSLAWCLAGRPVQPPFEELLRLAREITIDDVHTESPQRPYYRQTLDGWHVALAAG